MSYDTCIQCDVLITVSFILNFILFLKNHGMSFFEGTSTEMEMGLKRPFNRRHPYLACCDISLVLVRWVMQCAKRQCTNITEKCTNLNMYASYLPAVLPAVRWT